MNIQETHKIVKVNHSIFPFKRIVEKDKLLKYKDSSYIEIKYDLTDLGDDGKFIHPNHIRNNRINGNYTHPEDFLGFKFEYQSKSSIKSRNGYRWTAFYNINSGIYEEVEMDVYVYEQDEDGDVKEIIKEKYYVIKDDVVEKYIDFVKSYLKSDMLKQAEEWLNRNLKDKMYVEIREFNKLSWYDVVDDLDGKYFWILNEYNTTCGNKSVIIYSTRDGDENLKIADNIKGLVIGKGGSNIKELQRKYGIKFKIN